MTGRGLSHVAGFITFLILCSASVALTEDFKAIDGKEYKNVKVSRVEPDGIVLISKSGIAKVYFYRVADGGSGTFSLRCRAGRRILGRANCQSGGVAKSAGGITTETR